MHVLHLIFVRSAEQSERKRQLRNLARNLGRSESDTKSDTEVGSAHSSTEVDIPAQSSTEVGTPAQSPAAVRRPSSHNKLRCGWSVIGTKFITPNGKEFVSRAEASEYHTADVSKLEPARQDGWQVFMDATGTHCTRIVPDDTKFNSFKQAKVYAIKSNQQILGKDGWCE